MRPPGLVAMSSVMASNIPPCTLAIGFPYGIAFADMDELSIRVRVEMVKRGWDQKRLAQELGLTQATISRRLSGDRGWTVPDLAVLARALEIPAAELLELLPKRASAAS